MKIKLDRVSFRSSIQIKDFQHVHIEAGANVPPGADPRMVIDELKKFVAEELRAAKDGRMPTPRPAGRFRDLVL